MEPVRRTRRKRQRTVEPSSSGTKGKRRRLKRKAKTEAKLGYCEINGVEGCTEKKKCETVKLDGCECGNKICLACAKEWFRQSSTCPFCRAQVALINNTDVSFQRQREDHDTERPAFSFPYTDWFGDVCVFEANLERSRLFANKRGKFRLPKELLFVVKCIEESSGNDIVDDNAYYSFITKKLSTYRGRTRQALYRILFYFTMQKQSPVAFFFLMTLLRKQLRDTRLSRSGAAMRAAGFDLCDATELQISKAIFLRELPDKVLFEESALEVFKRNSDTRHWFLLQHVLCYVFPDHVDEIRVGHIEAPSDDEEEDDFFDNVLLLSRV